MTTFRSASMVNLPKLLAVFHSFVQRLVPNKTVVNGALFDINDAPYLANVKTHEELEHRLRQLDRRHLHARLALQAQL